MTNPAKAYTAEPYSYVEARALSEGLALSEPVAIALVRRGYRTPEQARSFLEADESHPAAAFESMGEISARLLEAIEGGRRIAVHGDFDVDGVCATTIAVGALRELGADCDWLIPDRVADGYGLTEAGVDALAERGTALVLTVDCGITSVEAVARARERGMEVIVTDHHQPGPELPECPILHPALSGYPFPGLCGTAVAWKLTQGLREAAGGDPGDAERDLDLVALATVADMVPLLGENRSLARRGLELARRAQRPGLRALIEVARCEPSTLDEGDLGFRLAPRINASGRLYRADAGVELFLTADRERAGAIAAELDRANRERRETEREVEAAAGAAFSQLPERLREAAAIVLAGPGWHPGVIGIVASRLAERHMRPAILISLDSEGRGRGSGRSVPGFDLLGGAARPAPSIWGDSAGTEPPPAWRSTPGRVEAFRRRLRRRTPRRPSAPSQQVRTERIDAVVGGDRTRARPRRGAGAAGAFGVGNPGVQSARSLGSRAGRARQWGTAGTLASTCTAASTGRSPSPSAGPRYRWRRTRRSTRRCGSRSTSGTERSSPAWCCGRCIALDEETGSASRVGASLRARRSRVVGALRGRDGRRPRGAHCLAAARRHGAPSRCGAAARRPRSSPSWSPAATRCWSSRPMRRDGVVLAAGASGLARFGAGAPRIACGRCPREAIQALRDPRPGGLALTDYAALGLVPDLPADYVHVVLVDPPPSAGLMAARRGRGRRGLRCTRSGASPRCAFALSVLEEQYGLRMALRSLFVELREVAPCEGEPLRAALRGRGEHPRSPELAARCASVLGELGLAEVEAGSGIWRLGVVSSDGTDLERSAAFRACGARHEEGKRYLESLRDR